MLPQTKVRVVKMFIADTGTYNTQYRRPYNSPVLDVGTLTTLQDRVASSGGKISPSMIGSVAPNIVLLSATPESNVQIANGWDTPRLRFQLEVEIEFGVGGKVTELILGYTDHAGVSLQGSLDERMVFHINSILKVRSTIANTPFGQKNYQNVVSATHVLVNNDYSGFNQNTTEKLRPEDIFSALSRNMYDGVVYDQRTALTDVAVFSNRKDCIPTNYVSDVMTAYQSALNDNTDNTGAINESYATARNFISAPSIAMDAFISALSQLQGTHHPTTFTYRDLFMMDNNITNNTVMVTQSAPMKAGLHYNGMTSDWHGSDNTTLSASILSTAVPSLMMELGITGLYFMSSNREIGGQPKTIVINSQAFSNMDISTHLSTFITRFEKEVVSSISFSNQIDYSIEMKVDLLGESMIRLSVGSEPFTDFVQPSFADALAVPILTTDRQKVSSLIGDIDTLLTVVSDYSQKTINAGLSMNYQPTTSNTNQHF